MMPEMNTFPGDPSEELRRMLRRRARQASR